MHLSRIDLNLFTVFDAIYREGGITPASKRLHLSQPAVSHALARLRELLDDPLFERRGNEMVPTPLARSLAITIGQSLGSLEQMLHRSGRFDPASSQRRFVVAVRESHELTFLPALMAGLGSDTENIDISAVRIERRDLEEDLQAGEIDVALDVALPLSSEVRREHVRSDPLAVLASRGHPTVQGSLDIATYLSLDHVLITGRRRGGGYEDLALGRLGMSRRIRVRCQSHAAASGIVARSTLLATMPRRQAEIANRETGNQLLPFPADIPPLETFMYWHANVDEDPAAKWFREKMLAVLRHNE
jgi:DNA-binding transcriptional LysR family regulator